MGTGLNRLWIGPVTVVSTSTWRYSIAASETS